MKRTLANSVRSTLSSGIAEGSTSITVNAAVSPWANPPTPASGVPGVLTITDSLSAPTVQELVTYTGVTDNGNGTLTLTGVLRAQEGTIARAWDAGAQVFQSITAGSLLTSPHLRAFDALTPSADTLSYFTGASTKALTALTAFGRSLIGAANAGAARTVLGAAADAEVVKLTGAQAVAGTKLFSQNAGFGGASLPQTKVDTSVIVAGLATYKGDVRVGAFSSDGLIDSGIEWQVRGDGAGYGWRAVNINDSSGNGLYFQYRTNSASWTNGIVFSGNGNVGLGGVTAPTCSIDTNGFTKLGESAPRIKLVEVTGTLGPSGTTQGFGHGVADPTKIIGIAGAMIGGNPPSSYVVSGSAYSLRVSGGDIVIRLMDGASSNLFSQTFTVTLMVKD